MIVCRISLVAHLVVVVVVALAAACAGCSDEDSSSAAPVEPAGAAPSAPAAPEDLSSAAVPEETARALEALGYVPSTPTSNPDDRGVTTQVPDASERGLNLFSSRRRASALLTDMDGQVLHRWAAAEEDGEGRRQWMHVEPLPTGEILAITKDHDLAKHAWDSTLVWRAPIRAHHDLAIHRDGRIFALVRDRTETTYGGADVPVLADGIAVLSADGQLQRTIDLLPLFREHVAERRLRTMRDALEGGSVRRLLRAGNVGDVLHTNSIEILEREIPGVAPAGSLLLSFRALSRIAIVNAEGTEVLWVWGQGELDGQHDARHLANGNILLFDNGLGRGRDSRVVEVNPVTGEIAWSFEAPDLYSRLRGGAQELPNGNILITESDDGRAFEITRSGDVVWEFWNPDVRGQGEDAERGVIYRLNRFPESFFEPLRNG